MAEGYRLANEAQKRSKIVSAWIKYLPKHQSKTVKNRVASLRQMKKGSLAMFKSLIGEVKPQGSRVTSNASPENQAILAAINSDKKHTFLTQYTTSKIKKTYTKAYRLRKGKRHNYTMDFDSVVFIAVLEGPSRDKFPKLPGIGRICTLAKALATYYRDGEQVQDKKHRWTLSYVQPVSPMLCSNK